MYGGFRGSKGILAVSRRRVRAGGRDAIGWNVMAARKLDLTVEVQIAAVRCEVIVPTIDEIICAVNRDSTMARAPHPVHWLHPSPVALVPHFNASTEPQLPCLYPIRTCHANLRNC